MRSALAAIGLASAAIALVACGGPTTSQPLSAGAHPGSAGSSAPVTPLMTASPSPPTSAAPATPAAAVPAQPSTAAAAPHALPSTALPSTAAAAPQAAPSTAAKAHYLAPVRLPAYNVESWTALTAGPRRDVSGHDIELNECATVVGAATWQQQPYVSSGGNSAILETYTFAASAQAGSAYAGMLSGMQSCQATSRALQTANHIVADAMSRQTASASDAAAFDRTWTGVLGVSAAGQQANHLYLAMRGTTVLVLHFDELGTQASPFDVRNDPGVLSTLISVLTAQGGTG